MIYLILEHFAKIDVKTWDLPAAMTHRIAGCQIGNLKMKNIAPNVKLQVLASGIYHYGLANDVKSISLLLYYNKICQKSLLHLMLHSVHLCICINYFLKYGLYVKILYQL